MNIDMKYVVRIAGATLAGYCSLFGLTLNAYAAPVKIVDPKPCMQATVADLGTRAEAGSTGLRVAEVTIANNCSENVTVNGLGFNGSFGERTLTNARISVNGMNAGALGGVKSYGASYGGLNIKLAKGGSAKIALIGDIAKGTRANSLTYRFNFSSKVFDVRGEQSGQAKRSAVSGRSTIYITKKTYVTSAKVEMTESVLQARKGTGGIKVAEVKITNTGTEDLMLSGFGVNGIFGEKGIKDADLFLNGRSIDGYADYRYSRAAYTGLEVRIPRSGNVVLTLWGDVSDGVTARTLVYRPSSYSSVFVAKGVESGKNARLSVSGKSTIQIIK